MTIGLPLRYMRPRSPRRDSTGASASAIGRRDANPPAFSAGTSYQTPPTYSRSRSVAISRQTTFVSPFTFGNRHVLPSSSVTSTYGFLPSSGGMAHRAGP